jgi:hypothetical protein
MFIYVCELKHIYGFGLAFHRPSFNVSRAIHMYNETLDDFIQMYYQEGIPFYGPVETQIVRPFIPKTIKSENVCKDVCGMNEVCWQSTPVYPTFDTL